MKKKIFIFLGFSFLILFYLFLPFLFFAQKYQYKGITFYSSDNFSEDTKQVIDNEFVNVQELKNLNASVFICNSFWKFFVFYPEGFDAFGGNRQLLGRIFIAKTDIAKNITFRNGKVNNERTFSSVVIHELGHSILHKKYGLKTFFIETWKEEGYCEYIAEDSSFGFGEGLKLFIEEKEDDSNSFKYFKYRLYVMYLFDYKNLTLDEIVAKSFDIDDLEKEIKDNINNGKYIASEK